MDLCNRCGKCCFYFFDGKLKKCRHLVFLTRKLSYCRIYPRGFGSEIDKKVYCNKETVYNYEGCPYNEPTKKDFSLSLNDS
jgi:hypothetical protein